MAKFAIPKVVRPLFLSEYEPEYGDTKLYVWVNPPRELMNKHREMTTEINLIAEQLKEIEGAEERQALLDRLDEIGKDIYAWTAEIWSQGEDDWTADEIRELAIQSQDTDPALWPWLVKRTLIMISGYLDRAKKASKRAS